MTVPIAAMSHWLVEVITELTGRGWPSLVATPADLLVLACAGTALVVALRWLIGATLTVAALLPGGLGRMARQVQSRVAPQLLVRLTCAALGGTVIGALPGHAMAASAGHRTPPPTAAAGPVIVTRGPAAADDGLPDPGWRVAPQGEAVGDAHVRPGDTLWDVAAARLPGRPTNAAIDRAWRSWYAANRATVGPDPDLILPGQRLVSPTPWGQR
jgi:hypothetical protein